MQQSEVQLPANNAELTAAMMEYSPETVHTWQKEGGFEANEQRVQATRQAVVAEMPPEYRESFAQGYDALPASIREKVANGARLSPGHGPNAWAQRLDMIERSLTRQRTADCRSLAQITHTKRVRRCDARTRQEMTHGATACALCGRGKPVRPENSIRQR